MCILLYLIQILFYFFIAQWLSIFFQVFFRQIIYTIYFNVITICSTSVNFVNTIFDLYKTLYQKFYFYLLKKLNVTLLHNSSNKSSALHFVMKCSKNSFFVEILTSRMSSRMRTILDKKITPSKNDRILFKIELIVCYRGI